MLLGLALDLYAGTGLEYEKPTCAGWSMKSMFETLFQAYGL